ncbi:hypothetical protein QW131_17305 [Roseibium salinum]|nr:hypothetical protein [Roseibium salinum]
MIAANVLHATADIRTTLENVRLTMARGGVLLMNETSKPTLFTHITFGLLDGWWRFTDPERRIPGTPSLTSEKLAQGAKRSRFRVGFLLADGGAGAGPADYRGKGRGGRSVTGRQPVICGPGLSGGYRPACRR